MIKYRNLVLVVVMLMGCGSGILDIHSSELPTTEKRIEFLSRRLVMYSEIEDTIFHLWDVNGKFSLGIPGPSAWDYKVVMKVNKSDLSKWIEDFAIIPEPEEELLQWGYELIQNQKGWEIDSLPTVYRREDGSGESRVIVAIFEQEGIVFKRVEQWYNS